MKKCMRIKYVTMPVSAVPVDHRNHASHNFYCHERQRIIIFAVPEYIAKKEVSGMGKTEEYNIYGGFATVYDLFMEDIPYDDWFRYIKKLLERQGIRDGAVVDLACGTGEITRRLADAGYQVTGVDLSEEMLMIAREKCDAGVLLLHQDMRKLELAETVKAVVCICDGMNYICSEEDLQQVFRQVNLFLEEGGIFLFDMKTEYFYREVLGNRVITDNREDASYIWENIYYEDEKKNEYLLTVYELVDDERDLFLRTDELHCQKAYDVKTVADCLREQGFSKVEVFEALTFEAPPEQTERIYFIAHKA